MRRVGILAGAAAVAVLGLVVGPRLRRRLRGREDASGAVASVATASATRKIAPGVHLLGPWGRTQTNAYLVHEESTWVLVDAGWSSDAPRIEAAARSLLGPGSVPSAILLTHVHPDHAGAARVLAQAWGCPVLVHPAEIPIATGDFAAMERDAAPLDHWLILPLMRALGRRRREAIVARSSLAGLVRPLDPDGVIPGLAGWRWVPAPGHTPGQVAYLRTRDRVLISGDALVTLEVNAWSGMLLGRQGLSGPPRYTTWDPAAAVASITALGDLEPGVLAPGHGMPLTGPATADAVRAFALEVSSMTRAARLPPRWFIRTAWVAHRALYGGTGGRLGLRRPTGKAYGLMRLHTVGRRTGAGRAAILAYLEDGPNLVTMAMNGWADPEPAWWLNLQAQPDTTVDLVAGPRAVHARAAEPDERPGLWARWDAYDTGLDAYAALRSRETAVVILEPRQPAG